MLYGEPRITRDIDITLSADTEYDDEVLIDIKYIRGWLKEFDKSSEKENSLKTFASLTVPVKNNVIYFIRNITSQLNTRPNY